MEGKVYEIPVALNDTQQEQMAGLEALCRLLHDDSEDDVSVYVSVNGKWRYVDYTVGFLMRFMCLLAQFPDFKRSFNSCVKLERADYCRRLFEEGRKAEVLSIFMTYPALVYEGEEKLLADLKREVALEQANVSFLVGRGAGR